MTGLPSAAPTEERTGVALVLAATRISQAVCSQVRAPGFSGAVLSVHRSVVNVSSAGSLLTLVGAKAGGLPNGVMLATDTPLDQIGIRPGMRVAGDGDRLAIRSAGVMIFLTGASIWSPLMPVLPNLARSTRGYRLDRALDLAGSAAPAIGLGPLLGALSHPRRGAGSPLARTVAIHLADLLEELRRDDPAGATLAAAPLIGLGPGATPSGDDLLVGLLAGLAASRHRTAASFGPRVAALALGRTTTVAEAFLVHAGRGEFAERVHLTAANLLDTGESVRRNAVADALDWGASSGADLLLGLLLGLQLDRPGLAERVRHSMADRSEAAA